MNRMGCWDLCMLFCCPPWPSRIAAKLAFVPPEPPTYSILENTGEQPLSINQVSGEVDKAAGDGGDTPRATTAPSSAVLVINESPFTSVLRESEKEKLEVFMAPTRRGNQIACLYVHGNRSTKTTILVSHGNAVDLGQMTGFLIELGNKLRVNVMSFDYSGYGMSTGRPSEKNLYADVECAFDQLRTRFGVPLEQIVLYGQSIGTASTVDLATRYKTGLVVLHSPLLSGLRVAFPGAKRSLCCDAFPNIDKVARIESPTLVIHGTDDEVIDFSHGQEIYESLTNPLEPLFITGACHNDCETFPQFLERLRQVISEDLRNVAFLQQQHQYQIRQQQQRQNHSPTGSATTD